MKAHYIQHVPFEGLGSIDAWLRKNQYDIGVTRLYAGDRLPDPEAVDVLIIMGGPMGVNDQDEYPWLTPEKAFIRSLVRTGKPVLGICLGAQLIASAMGASVYPNQEKEIGWFPVRATEDAPDGCFAFPPSLGVFHWHGETFDLPANAVLLAASEACRHQAFQLGDRVMGLQFHLETTPASARSMVDHCGHELRDAPWIQSAAQILEPGHGIYETANQAMAGVLDYLTRE